MSNLIQRFKEGICRTVISVVDFTSELAEKITEKTQEACGRLKQKIEKWIDPRKPTDKVPPDIIAKNEPLIKDISNEITGKFPDFYSEVENGNPEERVQKMYDLFMYGCQKMNVSPCPEFGFFRPDDEEDISLFGSYNWGEHKLELNVALITSGNPDHLKEVCGTEFHELVHARQYQAVQAWMAGESVEKFGYTTEYVRILADNFDHYIRPEENYEAYTKQPIEAEAFWFKEQILQQLA